ncbi:MAG: Amuc_1100 family pilus-like protein [Verrucomicrobia bacterium]|nr:Amuc_1100 family pilus-like protein [Verrucomicrobiota bacterium]
MKRNLGLVISGVVAVGLLLFSAFYLYSNYKKNNEARARLEAEYGELQRLSNLKPHPGKGDVDNIARAREQKAELVRLMQAVSQRFAPIPAIPDNPQLSGEDFSASLRRAIDQLNRRAAIASVIVPTNYNFSFEAEKRLVKFAPGSLRPLAIQLGEVNAICQILFEAKINKLTGLRRERVSTDDRTGPQSDYLRTASVTNDLAVVSPYEISFESFSAELADVISGFANSPHGMVVKGLAVGPARQLGAVAGSPGAAAYPVATAPATPIYTAPPGGEMPGGSEIRRPTFQRPTFGGAGASPYGELPAPGVAPTYAQPGVAYPAPGVAAATTQTLIDEHPLSVTLVVEVIKLLPVQEEQ